MNALDIAKSIALDVAADAFKPSVYQLEEPTLPLSIADSGFEVKHFKAYFDGPRPLTQKIDRSTRLIIHDYPVNFATGVLCRLLYACFIMKAEKLKRVSILFHTIEVGQVDGRMWRSLGVPETLLPRPIDPPRHKKVYGRTLDALIDLV